MEPLLMILVPGLLGGLVLALLIAGHRRGTPSIVRAPASRGPVTLVDQYGEHSRSRVLAGWGWLLRLWLSQLSDPRIRLATILAAVLGAALALVLIAMRRRTGALPSSGEGPDHPSMLGIDDERRRKYSFVCGEQTARQNVPGRCSFQTPADVSVLSRRSQCPPASFASGRYLLK